MGGKRKKPVQSQRAEFSKVIKLRENFKSKANLEEKIDMIFELLLEEVIAKERPLNNKISEASETKETEKAVPVETPSCVKSIVKTKSENNLVGTAIKEESKSVIHKLESVKHAPGTSAHEDSEEKSEEDKAIEKLIRGTISLNCYKSKKKACGLCGAKKDLVKTWCCKNWICNDEDQYVLFSFDTNSCHRNHRKYTVCSYHFNQNHSGKWQDCVKCKDDITSMFNLAKYVDDATNDFNFEKLEKPPKGSKK